MMHRLTVLFFWFYSLTVVVFGDQVVWEGGTNTPSAGVMHEFTGLDIATVSVYLTVEVYQTDFFDKNEYVTSIQANQFVVKDHCKPKLDCGHYYFSCINSLDVTGYVDPFQNISIAAYATDAVDGCPFKGFLFYVRYTLDIVYLPTSIPTARPTRSFAPTISVVPSISPSVTPSSLPSTNERIFEDGAIVATDGVSYTFENCDPINHTYYLTVEVYQTDFFDSSEYVSSIILNGHLVSDYCNPGLDCDPSYYSCFRDLVVTSYIDSGYLTVDVIGTAAVNQCPLGEYALYVRYSLRHVERSFPTSEPTISAPPSSSPSLSYSPTISHMPTVSPGPTILQVSSMESGSDSGMMSQMGALIILGIICVSSCIIYLSIRFWKHRSLNLCIGYQHILKKLNLSESATKRRKRKGDISGGAKQDRKKDRQSTRKREKSSNKTKARISSPLPRETRSKDNVVELNMDMGMDMEIDLEDGSNACEHTPLKASSCSDGSDSDSDYEGEGTLVRHLSTTVSPIRHAWTVDSLPTEEKRKSPVPYDEKGDSSDEEDSFDYDDVNVQVRLRYGESMPRLDETRMGTTTSSLAHGDTPVFDDIGIEDFDEEPFMGHRL